MDFLILFIVFGSTSRIAVKSLHHPYTHTYHALEVNNFQVNCHISQVKLLGVSNNRRVLTVRFSWLSRSLRFARVVTEMEGTRQHYLYMDNFMMCGL